MIKSAEQLKKIIANATLVKSEVNNLHHLVHPAAAGQQLFTRQYILGGQDFRSAFIEWPSGQAVPEWINEHLIEIIHAFTEMTPMSRPRSKNI
jgi:hypothetical protein